MSLGGAAALGASAGLRTFTPLCALALARYGPASRASRAAAALAFGELVADKLPRTPSRLQPPALAGRVASGAAAGGAVAGPAGACVGGAAALAASCAGAGARAALVRASGLPDPAIAVVEDALAITLAWRAAAAGAGAV